VNGSVFFNLHGVAEEIIERLDLDAPFVDGGGNRQRRAFDRQRHVPLKGNKDVFIAHKVLASQPVLRGHVVDLGIHDLGLGDLAQLLEHLFFLLGQRQAAAHRGREMPDFDQTGAAFTILAVKRDGDVVGFGQPEQGAAVPGDRINRDVPRHHRGRKSDVGHDEIFLF
jgi:hypothetical protein